MSDNPNSSVVKVQINAFKVYNHCLPGKWTQIICDSSCLQGNKQFFVQWSAVYENVPSLKETVCPFLSLKSLTDKICEKTLFKMSSFLFHREKETWVIRVWRNKSIWGWVNDDKRVVFCRKTPLIYSTD